MNTTRLLSFRLAICAGLLFLAAGCGGGGTDPGDGDVAADAAPDAAPDVAVDVPADVPPEDVRPDVAPDVAPDAPPDVPADVPADVPPDVPDSGPSCPTECCAPEDCDDGVDCTKDECRADGTCAHTTVICDDEDECTADRCSPKADCIFEPIPGCCPFAPLTELAGAVVDFEAGLAGWTVEDRARNTRPAEDPWDQPIVWQLDGERTFAGDGALYFGSAQRRSYDNGRRVAAAFTSPALALPAEGPELQLRVWLDAEEGRGYDGLTVTAIVPDGDGGRRVPLWTKPDGFRLRSWQRVRVELAAFAGQTIRLELLFDSVDGSTNRFEGAYVDDLTVGARCARPACAADDACDDANECTVDACTAGGCTWEPIDGCCLTGMDCDDRDACSVDRCLAGACDIVFLPTPGCCNVDADCDDGDTCTADRCIDSHCEYVPSGATACCATDADCADDVPCTATRCNAANGACVVEWVCECRYDARCDDGDDRCTEDRCLDGVCLNRATAAAGCCANEVFVDRFESTTGSSPRWIFDNSNAAVGWTFWNGPATQSSALYFGNPATGNYQTGARVQGTATTAPITLPAGVPLALSFDLYLAVESGTTHDTFRFTLVHGGGELTLFYKDFQTQTYSWIHVTKDLSGFAGHTIALRFYFDSMDAEGNDGEGVYVDEFALTSSCRSRECGGVLDCFDGFGATADLCVGGLCQYRLEESLCDSDAQCTDGQICTRDRCVLGGCQFEPIAGCCSSSAQCDDRNVCTLDTCEGTNPPLCQHRRIPSCCVTERDCDDGNPCTEDRCPAEGLFCDNVPIADCCLLNAQCADDEPCTRDRCVGNVCQNIWACCAADAECDDQDACTIDACVEGVCLFDVDPTQPACCTPTQVLEDFEDGTANGYEMSGSGSDAWRVLQPAGGAHGGTYTLYYGNASGTGYANNSYGEALSPVIQLPAGQELELSFWVRVDTESCCDDLYVYLEARGQQFEIGSWAGTRGWTEVRFDVSFLAGSTARLRFVFDSDGSITGTGAWVDDIGVHSTCARPPCVAQNDCDVPVPCVEARCIAGGCLFEELLDCCGSTAECNDLNPCTTDRCVDGHCRFAAVPGCCLSAQDCEGESECLIGACAANRCQLACDPRCDDCCLARADCDDRQICTVDECVDHTCRHTDVCCSSDEECDDGDDVCTTDACVGQFCRFLIDATIPGCCQQQTSLADFEGGSLGGFVTSGNGVNGDAWHVVTGNAHGGTYALRYGGPNGANYGNSTQGTAVGPWTFVPPGQELTLSFWFSRSMEGCCDYFRAFVETENQTWQLGSWNGTATWTEVTFDVTFLSGRDVRLRFEFTSDGSVTYSGVLVDDIALRSTCAPRACVADRDCTAPTGCVTARCLGGACDYQPGSDCCTSVAQCDDQNPCTIDACVADACVHQEVPGCCVIDAHCEDGIACTRDTCVSLRCQKSCDPACPNCCLSAADCDDRDACTRDRCLAYECVYQPLCCTSDEDCDDGDDVCTTERCVGGTCEITTDVANPACCDPQPVALDFEDGSLQGFTVTGNGTGGDGWRVNGNVAHTGRYSLYYGNAGGTAYANNSEGQAVSPWFELPPDQGLTLSFWYKRSMESCCDYFEAFLEFAEQSIALGRWNGTADWTEVRVDVSRAAGQRGRLRFTFDSDSSVTYQGAWVDDITVTSTCAPVPCTTGAQCPTAAGCVDWACVDGACRGTAAADCCSLDVDCNDGSSCTIDRCVDRRCRNTLDAARPGCCTTNAHCADGNPCTPDVCGGDLCVRACAPECPYDFPWRDDFTTALGLAGSCWTAGETTGWSIEPAGAGTAPRLLFSGAGAPAGDWEDCVVSPVIDAHRAYEATLAFWFRVVVSGSTDAVMTARLTTDGGLEWHELWRRTQAAGNGAGTVPLDVFELVDDQAAVQVAFCVASGSGPQPLILNVDDAALQGGSFVGERPEWVDVPDAWQVDVGQVATLDVVASDVDDDPLTVRLAAGPPFVTLTDHGDGTATLSATPGIGTAGEYTLTVEVDDTWVSVPATIPLTVVVPGVAPVVEPVPTLRVVPETVRNVGLRATDEDGQPLSWRVVAAPPFVTLRDAGDGSAVLTIKPHIADIGPHVAELTVSDTTQLVPLTVEFLVSPPGDMTLLAEDFEDGATFADLGWETRSDEGSVMNDWTLAPSEGDRAALFVDFPIVTGFSDALVSPVFAASALDTVAVRWTGPFRDYAFETAAPEVALEILASADGGETWVTIWTRSELDGDLPFGPFEADATAVLVGSATARVAFRISGGTSAALISWEIDDVIVWGTLAP